jgi:hypothetical protein
VLCSALGAPARAQSAPELGAPAGPVRVWYRSSDGCPDGVSFVERLSRLGRSAALAGVGDRVDFVVTLAARPDASSGRLERQTERSTVAIREVQAPACADVAEALALSLELALEPVVEGAPAATPVLALSAAEPVAPEAAAATALETQRERSSPPSVQERALALGAHGRLNLGLQPGITPGAALFAELSPPSWPVAARAGLHGAYGQSEVSRTSLGVVVLAGELDVCAWRWQAGAISLEPCLGGGLGLLQASSEGQRARSDRGLWASARALLRSRLMLGGALEPELQLGLLLPFTRYVFGAPEGDDLFRMRAIGGELSVGARWAP